VSRETRNTASRAGAEVLGKLLALALFAVLARETGEDGLGAFVFAMAYLQLATVPVDLGYDRWLVRRLAENPGAEKALLGDVLGLKLATAVPVFAAASLIVWGADSRDVVLALAPGMALESLGRSVIAVFTVRERPGATAASLLVQRVASAGIGITALAAGAGVVTVAGAYSVGALLGLIAALALLGGAPGRPRTARWREHIRAAAPFSIQELFTVAMFRLDVVLLALLATQAVVGRYGAAYRLFDATLFVSIALAATYSPMFTYLGAGEARAAFHRSLRAALVLLVPVAIVFAVFAEPLCRLIFGDGFADAAPALRILAPSVPLLGVVTLSVAVYVARADPAPMVRVTGVAAAVNLVANLVLIPPLEEEGAALAMLLTELVYCALAVHLAHHLLDRARE